MELFTKVICEGFVSKLRLNTPMIEYRKKIEEDTCIKEAPLDPNRKVAKVSRKSPRESSHEGVEISNRDVIGSPSLILINRI